MDRIKQFAVAFVCLVVLWILAAGHCGAVSAKHSLDMVLPATNLDNVSISDAIDFLRDVSGANIHVNWRRAGRTSASAKMRRSTSGCAASAFARCSTWF